MATFAESEASFKHRASEVRLSTQNIEAPFAKDVKTFNTFAFAVCSQPGQLNETKFQELCDSCSSTRLSIGAAASLRQLAYEAITLSLSIAAIKQRVDSTAKASSLGAGGTTEAAAACVSAWSSHSW